MEERGRRVTRNKAEYLCFNGHQELEVWMQDRELKNADDFKYLGSHVSADGNLDVEVNHQIQSDSRNWKKMSGVFCDRENQCQGKGESVEVSGEVDVTCCAGAWPVKKSQEQEMDAAEMRMQSLR